MSQAVILPNGTKGFDCNTQLDASTAARFYEGGYRFAIRYIPRTVRRSGDITSSELKILHDAGLAVMLVQHVESESSWIPTPAKATNYATTAVAVFNALRFPVGCCVWLDLEGINPDISSRTTLDYCNRWYDIVADSGAIPGIYVGWHCGLSSLELYVHLRFQHYWGAYNLDVDREPAVRGLQLKQQIAVRPAGLASFPYDDNHVRQDRKGGLPSAFAPSGWAA